jgi:uncharacterized protein (TIGR03118 family)
MKKISKPTTYLSRIGLFLGLFSLVAGCQKFTEQIKLKEFQQVNLVDNNGEYHAFHKDTALQNAWGLAFSANGIPWVNAQAAHVSAVYDAQGNTVLGPVGIPGPGNTTRNGSPTGIVFSSSSTDFMLSNHSPARFIFVGDDGVLSGWNFAAGLNALLIHDNSATAGYKGLTLATAGGATMLYAADFKTGKIDVWDASFTPVTLPFTDPDLPSDYSPFNIQNIDGKLYVTYAKKGGEDEVKGLGFGYVDIFSPNGIFSKRFISKGKLNAPWGIAKASANFFKDNDGGIEGTIENGGGISSPQPSILVGNFGDGHINVYDLNGAWTGQLQQDGKPIVIDGLWALQFPPSTATTINRNRLYFTAGPDDEHDGIFGYIIKE